MQPAGSQFMRVPRSHSASSFSMAAASASARFRQQQQVQQQHFSPPYLQQPRRATVPPVTAPVVRSAPATPVRRRVSLADIYAGIFPNRPAPPRSPSLAKPEWNAYEEEKRVRAKIWFFGDAPRCVASVALPCIRARPAIDTSPVPRSLPNSKPRVPVAAMAASVVQPPRIPEPMYASVEACALAVAAAAHMPTTSAPVLMAPRPLEDSCEGESPLLSLLRRNRQQQQQQQQQSSSFFSSTPL